MKKTIIVDIISSLLILLFLYTGIMKFIDHDTLLQVLYKSPLLTPKASKILVYLIPIGELLIVFSLLLPRTKRFGLYCSFYLMILFTLYVGFMLYFRSDRPCTCGGVIQLMNWHQHLYFNILFTILAFLAIWLDPKNRKPKKIIDPKNYVYHNLTR